MRVFVTVNVTLQAEVTVTSLLDEETVQALSYCK